MNRGIYMAIAVIASLSIQGCAYNEMTYFRKHGATVPDERREWGLCGGNFQPDGQVWPTIDTSALKCMSEKGYQSLNDYYVEQQISFINRSNPDSIYIDNEILEQCGFRRVDGLCKTERYIPKSQLSRIIRCMSGRSYEVTLPRYKSAFRIIENDRGLSPNFCLTMTPRNGKEGVSLGGWRFE